MNPKVYIPVISTFVSKKDFYFSVARPHAGTMAYTVHCKSGSISETVVKSKVAYDLSNRAISVDLEWP